MPCKHVAFVIVSIEILQEVACTIVCHFAPSVHALRTTVMISFSNTHQIFSEENKQPWTGESLKG